MCLRPQPAQDEPDPSLRSGSSDPEKRSDEGRESARSEGRYAGASERLFVGLSGLARYNVCHAKGISLVAVVIVMLIAAGLALLAVSFMSSGNISAVTDIQAEQAFYIAQAGTEWYLEQLQGDNNWKTAPAVKTNQAFGAGTFSVTYANNSKDSIDVVSAGKVNAWDGNIVQRVVKCHVNRASGVMTISLWQESL